MREPRRTNGTRECFVGIILGSVRRTREMDAKGHLRITLLAATTTRCSSVKYSFQHSYYHYGVVGAASSSVGEPSLESVRKPSPSRFHPTPERSSRTGKGTFSTRATRPRVLDEHLKSKVLGYAEEDSRPSLRLCCSTTQTETT